MKKIFLLCVLLLLTSICYGADLETISPTITGDWDFTGGLSGGGLCLREDLSVAKNLYVGGSDFTVDANAVNLSDTTDEYVLAFDTTTQTWRGVVMGGGGETLAQTLALGADANDLDITSMDKLEGFDANVFVDLGADGYADIDADTAIRLYNNGNEILTVGDLGVCIIGNVSNTGNIYSGGDIYSAGAITLAGNLAVNGGSITSTGSIHMKADGDNGDYLFFYTVANIAYLVPTDDSTYNIGLTSYVFAEGWFDEIASDGDITLDPAGVDVLIDGGLTVGSATEAGDNNLRVEGDIDVVGRFTTSSLGACLVGNMSASGYYYGDGSKLTNLAGGATYREMTLLPQGAVLDDDNPAVIDLIESTGTATPRFYRAKFDDGDNDALYYSFVMPSDTTASGDLILDIYWYSDEDVAEDVVWGVQVSATTADDADNVAEQAADTVDTVTDSADASEATALIKATITIDYANCDGAVAGDWVVLKFYRVGGDGSDTHTNECYFVNGLLKIPRS